MSDHRLYLNEGTQAIRTVPCRPGTSRPVVVGSGTYEVHDLRYPEDSASRILDSGNVTLDSVNTTLSAAAGRGTADPRSLTVASAVGLAVGHRYVLQQGGRLELIELEGISGTTLRLRTAVVQPFPALSTALLGVEVSCEVPAEVTAHEVHLGADNLAVRWELGDLPPVLEPLFLERAVVAPIISRQDLLSLDRTLEAYDGEGLPLDLAIAQAQSDLSIDLLTAGHDDSRVMSGPIGREALKHAAAYHALKHAMNEAEVRRAEYYRKRYEELRSSLLVGLDKAKVTHLDGEGAKAPKDYRSLFAVAW